MTDKLKWKGIVKLQRPLAGEMTQVLVYNEDRSIQEMFQWSEKTIKLFFGKDKKVYCHAHARRDGVLVLDSRCATHPDW